MNLALIIDGHADERIALIDDNGPGTEPPVVVTYAMLRNLVAQARQTLFDAGVRRGSRVVVTGGNDTHFVVATLAALGVGAAVVPVLSTGPFIELERKLSGVSPELIIVDPAAPELVANAHRLEAEVIIESLALNGDSATSATSPASSPQPVDNSVGVVNRRSDDLAFLIPTSGVTGNSRVVQLSHYNLEWVQKAITTPDENGITGDDTLLGVLPMSHIFGLNVVLLAGLRVGAKIVLQRRFDVAKSLRAVQEHQVTVLSGAPPMWRAWANSEIAQGSDDSVFASVRHASSGAAALPTAVFHAIKNRYGIEIAEGYGLTETSPVVTWSRGMQVKPGSVGRPLDGVELMLVEPDGTPVELGDTGEVVVRSPGVFRGYLNEPDATDSCLTADGWFWTGDVGLLDADGYLYLVDRVKDIIIVNGFNVYPSEVEAVLADHPEVAAVVVVGRDDPITGETVEAHVVGKSEKLKTADLEAFAGERLSRYKCPTRYHFDDQLPIAPTGKAIRRMLRK